MTRWRTISECLSALGTTQLHNLRSKSIVTCMLVHICAALIKTPLITFRLNFNYENVKSRFSENRSKARNTRDCSIVSSGQKFETTSMTISVISVETASKISCSSYNYTHYLPTYDIRVYACMCRSSRKEADNAKETIIIVCVVAQRLDISAT